MSRNRYWAAFAVISLLCSTSCSEEEPGQLAAEPTVLEEATFWFIRAKPPKMQVGDLPWPITGVDQQFDAWVIDWKVTKGQYSFGGCTTDALVITFNARAMVYASIAKPGTAEAHYVVDPKSNKLVTYFSLIGVTVTIPASSLQFMKDLIDKLKDGKGPGPFKTEFITWKEMRLGFGQVQGPPLGAKPTQTVWTPDNGGAADKYVNAVIGVIIGNTQAKPNRVDRPEPKPKATARIPGVAYLTAAEYQDAFELPEGTWGIYIEELDLFYEVLDASAADLEPCLSMTAAAAAQAVEATALDTADCFLLDYQGEQLARAADAVVIGCPGYDETDDDDDDDDNDGDAGGPTDELDAGPIDITHEEVAQ